ncbi:DUF58 domain-containing protein [Derxia lacustris]|uniref:DUF58 domain-containing protein n=1 Tax=Derxia lacustris TaxID=764842 RepID=UPI000A176853|nr:hypothetical protein [Derxia lacustris]
MTAPPPLLLYSARRRGRRPWAGEHRSLALGPEGEYARSEPFVGQGDLRRFDLRAAARDPWERDWVRRYRQPALLDVVVLADVSRSLDFDGTARRRDVLRDLACALAWSAWRRGDGFGFVAADERPRAELHLATARRAGRHLELARRLDAFRPDGRGAAGLVEAARQLGARPALVFWVSDMHLPPALIDAVLLALAAHEVVPVVLADPAEFTPPARWGLASLRDLEGGGERLLLLRPGLAPRLEAARGDWRHALGRRLARAGRAPVWIDGAFDAARFNRHFLAEAA